MGVFPCILIGSNWNYNETMALRQWHHWNRKDSLTIVKLKKEIHTLTPKTVTTGYMNYDYPDFKLLN